MIRGTLPVSALLLGALAACSSSRRQPTRSRPARRRRFAYKESAGWKPAQPVDDQSRGDWWTLFQDAQLNELEEKVGDANQNLKAVLRAFAAGTSGRVTPQIVQINSTALPPPGP